MHATVVLRCISRCGLRQQAAGWLQGRWPRGAWRAHPCLLAQCQVLEHSSTYTQLDLQAQPHPRCRLYLDVPDPKAQPHSGQSGQGGQAAGAAAGAAYPAASGGVQLDTLGRRAPGWDIRRVGPAQQPQPAAAAVAAAVALVAAAAVAAAGGLLYARQRRVWQQQQWQRLDGSDCAEEGPALMAGYQGSPAPASPQGTAQRPPAAAPATARGPKATSSTAPAAAPAEVPAVVSAAALVARLSATVAAEPPTAAAAKAAALLRAELESWDGAIDLMPLEALPAALAQAAAAGQQQAAEGGAEAAQQQQGGAPGAVAAAAATAAQAAVAAAGLRAAAPAATGKLEEITPLDNDPQHQHMQHQQWGAAQQQHEPQWHSLAPPQQAQRQGQPGSCSGPASTQLCGSMTSSRGVHSGAPNSRGVHSARSTHSTQSSSSMGCDGGQWSLQSTLLLLSPGELTVRCAVLCMLWCRVVGQHAVSVVVRWWREGRG